MNPRLALAPVRTIAFGTEPGPGLQRWCAATVAGSF